MLLKTKFVQPSEDIREEATIAKRNLFERPGRGTELADWFFGLGPFIASEKYKELKKTAEMIRNRDSAVIIIGLEEFYLGARAVIESENGSHYNELTIGTKIYFAGNDFSTDEISAISEILEAEDFSIIYISKTGENIEPALTFRFFYKKLVNCYGQNEADKRVIAITCDQGNLRNLAEIHNWKTFSISKGIDEKYSVFSPESLLLIAITDIDTDKLIKGALRARNTEAINNATDYAMFRQHMKKNSKCTVEFLAVNNQKLQRFGEWYKYLFTENESKKDNGIFPTSGNFPSYEHFLGQYFRSTTKSFIFETQLIQEYEGTMIIPGEDLEDGFEELSYSTFNYVANATIEQANRVHQQNEIPVGRIYVQSSTEAFGYLLQFMMIARAISGYMCETNSF